MTKDDIRVWIDALRSGNYNQTTGTLKEQLPDGDYGYCCLGVCVSVLGEEPQAEIRDDVNFIEEDPMSVYRKLEEELGKIGIDQDILIQMNDEGKTFQEIADRIEEMMEDA
jgi:hypothetical protein